MKSISTQATGLHHVPAWKEYPPLLLFSWEKHDDDDDDDDEWLFSTDTFESSVGSYCLQETAICSQSKDNEALSLTSSQYLHIMLPWTTGALKILDTFWVSDTGIMRQRNTWTSRHYKGLNPRECSA